MSELAACYFCGAALDASVSTVRLGDGPTLSLCGSCQEKLERVLEAVDTQPAAHAADPDPSNEASDRPPTAAGEPDSTPAAAADPEPGDGTAPTESDDRSVVDGEQDVSALEYNKVMRMLQNRDFPVNRDEFVAVAANAYQVSYADCDQVIDAAIEQGLVDEADGQLIRPD